MDIISIIFLIILSLVFFFIAADDPQEPSRAKRYWIAFLGLLLIIASIWFITKLSEWAEKPIFRNFQERCYIPDCRCEDNLCENCLYPQCIRQFYPDSIY